MAEVLGLVAGGFGAASLAIQLLEKTDKLRTFLKSVKEAPKEAQGMLTNIEILADVLCEIEELHQQPPDTPVSEKRVRALKRCQEAVNEAKSVVDELDACCGMMDRRLSLEGLRVYRQKERAEAVSARAQHALQLLLMNSQLLFQ